MHVLYTLTVSSFVYSCHFLYITAVTMDIEYFPIQLHSLCTIQCICRLRASNWVETSEELRCLGTQMVDGKIS